jgi:NADH dehydrogenase
MILVTGGAGFVGNNTIRRLLKDGHSVRAQARDLEKAQLRLGDLRGQVEIVKADISDRDALQSIMDGVTAVVHTVAIPQEKGRATYEAVNTQGTINVVDAAKNKGVKRFINVSQNGARADHWSAFLRSKGKAQAYVAASGLDWTAVKPSAIFGPQDEFFNTFARLARVTPVIFPLVGGGTAQFQPVSINDVVEVIARSLRDDGTIGREFELGGPEVLTLGEIEKRVLQALGSSRIMFPASTGLLRPAVIVMQSVLPGSPVNTTLLDLLKAPNVVSDNALVSYFHLDPRPFSGANIAYLKTNTAGTALKKFFSNATVS